ncbi:TonB-dependent siderophore receptor [Sphingomonas sp. 28-63-12]|uniref:TonB-dependent receptor n=1 Tax=Sphingomonas sp. 28-63-12 TaxID=1970434 RepID=UPI000BCB0EDD|nr:MAG: TonB-dependent siderophore receptor [Sphingomonas sp. 28-63-12]
MSNLRPATIASALFVASLASSVAMPAFAHEAAPADLIVDADDQRPDIVVNGQRTSYATSETRSATRTDTKLLDIPQALTAISKEQIDDRAFRSIADVLRAVPGAIPSQGEGNRDQIVLRGNGSTADFFVDGLRDDVQYYRPLYNLDRVEVLRGPNAMTFGRGGGGGIVNRVTKTPEAGNFGGGSVSGDTFGAWYIDGDANLTLADGVGLRVNAVREQLANHRDVYAGHVTAVNPVVKLLGSTTSVTLSYEYNDDDRVTDRGVPSADGRAIAGFRDTFFGVADVNRTQFTGNVGRATIEHRFTDRLRVTERLLYGAYDKYYRNAFASGAVTGIGAARRVPVQAYFDTTTRDNLISQTDIVWQATTGPIEHVLLAGAEFGRQTTNSHRLNGFFDGVAGATNNNLTVTAALTDPFIVPPIIFRPGSGQRDNRSTATVYAGYVQDQLEFGPVELLLGVRHDRFNLDVTNRLTGQLFSRSDALWSPRAGLVVHPIRGVSLYGSYARSYLPQSGDQFTSLDITTASLKPERFDSYEFGAKWEPHPGLLIAADLYQLDRTNTRAPGPVAGTTVLAGAQRSRGVEIEAQGAITASWQLSLAYALQDAKIVETTNAAPAGRQVALVPRHTFSAFSRYQLTPRLGIGAGVSHLSDRFASISNTVVLPAYTRVDAALYYKISNAIEAQVNVENLFDAGYFPTSNGDNNISTGAPINARATLRFRL